MYKLHASMPYLALALVELAVLLASAYLGISIRLTVVEGFDAFGSLHLPQPLLFAAVVIVIMFALGLYNAHFASRLQDILVRLLVCFLVSFVIFSVTFYVIPILEIWRSSLGISMAIAFSAIMIVRYTFLHIIDLDGLRRRILVIGVGDHAAEIEARQRKSRIQAYQCVGFVQVQGEEPKVSGDKIFPAPNSMLELAVRNDIDEIVVAPQDRRGHIPMTSLLECRVNGIKVSDFVGFCERETGRVNLDALHPSWFVYSDSIPGTRVQQSLKRLFDVIASLVFLIACFPIFVATAIAIRFDSPGPVFYVQERMGHRGRSFRIIKFRSMRLDAERDGVPKWAECERFAYNAGRDRHPQAAN